MSFRKDQASIAATLMAYPIIQCHMLFHILETSSPDTESKCFVTAIAFNASKKLRIDTVCKTYQYNHLKSINVLLQPTYSLPK